MAARVLQGGSSVRSSQDYRELVYAHKCDYCVLRLVVLSRSEGPGGPPVTVSAGDGLPGPQRNCPMAVNDSSGRSRTSVAV